MDKEIFINEQTQLDFKSLAPKTDVDLSVYKEAFLFALSNDEIKNVAVTGSYGAGKSSVMETFKKTKEGSEYKYLHVSLAHFEKVSKIGSQETTEEQLEHQLEGKIINQLVHKIPVEKILDSKVSLKKIPDEKSVRKWSIGIIVGVILIIYFCSFSSMANTKTQHEVLKTICEILTKTYVLLPAVLTAVGLGYQLAKYLVKAQMKNRFFKKICIKDSEIELFGEENEHGFSYFDRYLDEIKYLLLNSDVDVFVFEDIDRYNTNLIFEKLREINHIINTDRKTPIRFFYLIRDDLFMEKDRTKFFDFIIPILPVVSKHNSFNMYLKYVEAGALSLKREFLKQISLYIDDMRILNNIYNEYQIYQQRLKGISVNKSAEKIFSLVTYKNLFPEEFICLQRGEGYVVSLFEEKEKQVEKKEKEFDDKIAERETQIKEEEKHAQDELLKDSKEVDALFLKLDEIYRCGTKERGAYDSTAEFVADLILKPDQVQYRSGSYWYDAENKIRSAITNMNKNPEYQKRKAQIARKQDYLAMRAKVLRENVLELKQEKELLHSLNFQEYANKYGFESIQANIIVEDEQNSNQHNIEISKSLYAKLIRFLLLGGYIDENYADFIVAFQNDDISQKDKKYVRAVLDNEPLEYMYPIERPRYVCEYLDEKHLQSEAFFNRDMFYHYMTYGTEKQKDIVTSAIVKWKKYDFASMLLDDEILPYISWIERVCFFSANILQYLVQENGEVDKAELFAAASLLCVDIPNYAELNDEMKYIVEELACGKADVFEQVIEHDKLSLSRRADVILNLVDNLDLLGWKLPYFEFNMKESRDFADAIYENNLYQINPSMIRQILWKYYEIKTDENETHLYDKIVATSEQNHGEYTPIYKYVDDNMNAYIDMVIDSNIPVEDSSQNVSYMILAAGEDHQESLISYMNTCVVDVVDVNQLTEVNRLIRHGKLSFRSSNIFQYYDLYMDVKTDCEERKVEFKGEDLLIKFICDFPEDKIVFVKDEVYKYGHEKDDRMGSLMTKISRSDEISNEKYRSIVTSLNRIWRKVAPSDIPENKIDILIEENIIKMTKETLPGMREKYPSHMRAFIMANVDEYFDEVIDKENFKLSECVMLLEEDITDARKMELLAHTKTEISVQNDKYSEELVQYILENNYSEDDFEYLIQQDYENKDLQAHVNGLAENRVAEIIKNDYKISKTVCKYMLDAMTDCITLSQKKQWVAQYMEYFSRIELQEIMRGLELNAFLPIFENKNPLIESNAVNDVLLLALQKNEYIGKFIMSEKEEGYYRVYSKKNK